MCELFAMSSRYPADVHFSLEAFSRRGGLDGRLKDGWGIGFCVDDDVQLIRETQPAADSACVRFIQDHPLAATIVVSHIRRATQGAVTLKNCQPFQRELGGRMHLFAHNGNLDLRLLRARMHAASFRSVGDTDSEYAFCALLDRLRALWRDGMTPPLASRRSIVAQFAGELRALGPANFIYSDGDALFIHGHKRHHDDSTELQPPGLHVLRRHCGTHATALIAQGLLVEPVAEQEVVLAASVPLTDDSGWRALAEGELVVAQRGSIVSEAAASPEAHVPAGI